MPSAVASGGQAFQPPSFAPIVHAADPGVVTVRTLTQQVEISPFTHTRRPRQSSGLGTGFVVDKGGVIVTNDHVVEGAQEIQVKTWDDHELPARVVGTDPPTDIAVLRIDPKDLNLRALPLGDSDAIEVGDWVVAIGNPFSLSHTVSAGILSAKGRTKEDVPLDQGGYYDFLQTDASINPGNSGGPLLNLRGQVVGMNSATNRAAQGLSFAIPINMIKQLLPVLLRDGHLTRSALGVHIIDPQQVPKEDRQAFGLPEGEKSGVASSPTFFRAVRRIARGSSRSTSSWPSTARPSTALRSCSGWRAPQAWVARRRCACSEPARRSTSRSSSAPCANRLEPRSRTQVVLP